MQLDRIGIRIAHLGNYLALADTLPFLDHDAAVMRVGGQQAVIVLHNNEITITPDTAARIHHFACAGGNNLLSRLAGNVDTLVFAFIESGDDLPVRWPDPA